MRVIVNFVSDDDPSPTPLPWRVLSSYFSASGDYRVFAIIITLSPSWWLSFSLPQPAPGIQEFICRNRLFPLLVDDLWNTLLSLSQQSLNHTSLSLSSSSHRGSGSCSLLPRHGKSLCSDKILTMPDYFVTPANTRTAPRALSKKHTQKYSKHDFCSASEIVFPGILGVYFICSISPRRGVQFLPKEVFNISKKRCSISPKRGVRFFFLYFCDIFCVSMFLFFWLFLSFSGVLVRVLTTGHQELQVEVIKVPAIHRCTIVDPSLI